MYRITLRKSSSKMEPTSDCSGTSLTHHLKRKRKCRQSVPRLLICLFFAPHIDDGHWPKGHCPLVHSTHSASGPCPKAQIYASFLEDRNKNNFFVFMALEQLSQSRVPGWDTILRYKSSLTQVILSSANLG